MENEYEFVDVFGFVVGNPRITVSYNNGTIQIIDEVYQVDLKQLGTPNVLMIVSEVKTFYINLDSVCYWAVESGE